MKASGNWGFFFLMKSIVNSFPIYRKLDGFDRYYQITGERHFTEVYMQHGLRKKQFVCAEQYPEILRIQDMIQCNFQFVPMSLLEIEIIFNSNT